MFACDQLAIKGPQDRWAPYTIIAGATLTIVGLALELADTVGAGLGRFPQSLWLTGLTALLAGAIAIGQAEILDSYRDLTSVVRWALGATITFSIALVLAAVVAIEQDASEEWTGLLVGNGWQLCGRRSRSAPSPSDESSRGPHEVQRRFRFKAHRGWPTE